MLIWEKNFGGDVVGYDLAGTKRPWDSGMGSKSCHQNTILSSILEGLDGVIRGPELYIRFVYFIHDAPFAFTH